jgi:hypothetical protein
MPSALPQLIVRAMADHTGWVVMPHHPKEQTFYGRTLEEALAWCQVWLMVPDIGGEPVLH